MKKNRFNWRLRYKDDIKQNPHKYFKGFSSIIGLVIVLSIITTMTSIITKHFMKVWRIHKTNRNLQIVLKAISNYAVRQGVLPYPSPDLNGESVPAPEDENSWTTEHTIGYIPWATLNLPKDYAFNENNRPIYYYINPTMGARNSINNAPITNFNLLKSNTLNAIYIVSVLDKKQTQYRFIHPQDVYSDKNFKLSDVKQIPLLTNYLYTRYSDPNNRNDLCSSFPEFQLIVFTNGKQQVFQPNALPIVKTPIIEFLSPENESDLTRLDESIQKPLDCIAFALVSYKEPQIPQPGNVIRVSSKDKCIITTRSNIACMT
jgi:hypothetical protein